MSEGLPGVNEIDAAPDVQILVRYYYDDNTNEWFLNLMTEGLDEENRTEEVIEFLSNALEVAKAGGLPFE